MHSPHSCYFSVCIRSTATILVALSLLLSGCANVAPRTPPSTASLALSAASFNFNTVAVGQTATQTLHVSNSGSAPLTIESLSLKSQQFSFAGPSVPRTVLPAQGVDYTISFVPTTSGSLSASLQITTDASSTPASISLAGVGEKTSAALQVSPSSINFGNFVLHTTGTQTVTLKNTGDTNLTISGVTVAGAGFGFSNLSPGLSLSPNQSVSFQIWFRPDALGASAGTVSILSANIPSPASIRVSGDGVNSTTTPASRHSVSLSWHASHGRSIAGYRVYRNTVPDTDLILLTEVIPADLTYVDSTVVSGNTYAYVVTAVNSDGEESHHSNEVTVVIP